MCLVGSEDVRRSVVFFKNRFWCSEKPRHHFMLDVYKKDLKGRKQIEETIMAEYGLKVGVLSYGATKL